MLKIIKKHSKLVLLSSFILLVALSFTGCDNGVVDEVEDSPEIVEFEDSNLEAAVREEINKPEGDILLEEVKDIEDLEAPGEGIESLEGIQYLENLESLFLNNNQISNINVLSDLTALRSLFLWKNNISDINPLTNLTNLEGLNFATNKVSDISALENLNNLNELHFRQNEIKNIAPISELTNLEILTFSDNEVADISHIANLTNLEWLDFRENEVSDISPLVANDGFRDGDEIFMTENYLDLTDGSEDMDNIDTLKERGVDVEYEPQREK